MKISIRIKNLLYVMARFWNGLSRPSEQTNRRLLHQRGETLASFVIRDARVEDIHKLAMLHVKTWSDTYGAVPNSTMYNTREHQWREQFRVTDGSWFCLVVEDPGGKLVGFAKGMDYSSKDLPGYSGELNKIYLLKEYQRIGLGRRLFNHVVERFLSKGITSMVLFGIPQNPSCHFHEALGGQKLIGANGGFHGGYGWPDLNRLAMPDLKVKPYSNYSQ